MHKQREKAEEIKTRLQNNILHELWGGIIRWIYSMVEESFEARKSIR